MMAIEPTAAQLETERLAIAFAIAGHRSILTPGIRTRLSPAGRIVFDVLAYWPSAVVRAVGLEWSVRVWRHGLLPHDRDRLVRTRADYRGALCLARAVDRTTVQELAAEPWPELLLRAPIRRQRHRSASSTRAA